MHKLIRKERNIYYEHYEVELTDEQFELYKNDREKFFEDFVFDDQLDFQEVAQRYVTTTDTEYYIY
jgi:hypothetical protein